MIQKLSSIKHSMYDMAWHQQIVCKSHGTFDKLIPGFEVCYSCTYYLLSMIGCRIVIEPVATFLLDSAICHFIRYFCCIDGISNIDDDRGVYDPVAYYLGK